MTLGQIKAEVYKAIQSCQSYAFVRIGLQQAAIRVSTISDEWIAIATLADFKRVAVY